MNDQPKPIDFNPPDETRYPGWGKDFRAKRKPKPTTGEGLATASELEQLAREAAEGIVNALEGRGYLDFDAGEELDRISVVDQATTIILSVCQKVQELTRKEGEQ